MAFVGVWIGVLRLLFRLVIERTKSSNSRMENFVSNEEIHLAGRDTSSQSPRCAFVFSKPGGGVLM